jgi:hypothetical protein
MRTYDKGYKVKAVKLGQEIGCKKAAELGIPSGTLYCESCDGQCCISPVKFIFRTYIQARPA